MTRDFKEISESSVLLKESQRGPVYLDLHKAIVVNGEFIIQIHYSSREAAGSGLVRKVGIFARARVPVRYPHDPVIGSKEGTPGDRVTYIVKALSKDNPELLVGNTKVISVGRLGDTYKLRIETPDGDYSSRELNHSIDPRGQEAQRILDRNLSPASTSPS